MSEGYPFGIQVDPHPP